MLTLVPYFQRSTNQKRPIAPGSGRPNRYAAMVKARTVVELTKAQHRQRQQCLMKTSSQRTTSFSSLNRSTSGTRRGVAAQEVPCSRAPKCFGTVPDSYGAEVKWMSFLDVARR